MIIQKGSLQLKGIVVEEVVVGEELTVDVADLDSRAC